MNRSANNNFRYAVHLSHCCKWHGCKYGDKNCPVVLGTEHQLYLCEYCDADLENEEHYKRVLNDIAEIKKFKKSMG